MACNGCTSSANGKPTGCKSNGSCSNGGCNRLNTYDWLSGVQVGYDDEITRFIEVSFKNGSRKEIFRNNNKLPIDTHDVVVVETEMGGQDVGVASLTGELVRLQMKRKKIAEDKSLRSVIRKANDFDMNRWEEARKRDQPTMVRARAIARSMNLDMKIGDVEFQGDGKKAIFYYIAENRVDFRELIKAYAAEFKVKVEMNHIGARQEAARIGGIGSCGRELCCSTWLTEFKGVTTSAARYQQLSINQAKLSGQCGRLKCCLNYELDTYLDALQDFPKNLEKIETESGIAYLQKTDVFRRLMYFTYKEKNVFHPLTVDKVNEIVAMNKNGVKPADLGNYAVKTPTRKSDTEEDLKYADTVGQTTLESLGGKKKKSRNRGRDRERRDGKNQPQHKTENRNQNQPQQKGKQQSQEQKQNQPQQKSPAKPQQKPKQNPQQNRTKPNRYNSGPTRPSVG
ncbi:MAG TPA: hypothetical protein DCQ93_08660 [Bacteroidetes bacterium]|nr:hypothetical protein [Bacteroidota bacterium]